MRTLALLTTAAILLTTACGGGDETAGIDRSKVDTASKKFKDSCETVCTTVDKIRSQSCGQAQYATHDACYLHCVDDYQRLPQCESLFDELFDCINQYVCQATTTCIGQVAIAAACRDGKYTPSP